MAVQKLQTKRKNEDAEEFANSQAEAAKSYKLKKKAEIDEDERIRRFTYSNLFGPIFICRCCRRRFMKMELLKLHLTSKKRSIERNLASTMHALLKKSK